jgi:hypothetical protein
VPPVRLVRACERRTDVVRVDVALAELSGSDEDVPKLPNVAGPRVFGERVDGAGGDLGA